MKKSDYYSVPNDPEFEMLLRRAYNIDSDEEKERTLNIIRDDTVNEEIFEGILITRKEKGFKSIEEHLKWVEEDKKKDRILFNNYKAKLVEKQKHLRQLITYAVAASIVGFIFSFGVFKMTLTDQPVEGYITKAQYDSLEKKNYALSSLVGENEKLMEEVAKIKQTSQVQNEKLRVLERNPTAINEIALYKKLAEKKGYKDNEGLFTLPDTEGIYAGGDDNLEISLKAPSKMEVYFIDESLIFSWATNLKGSGKLKCYVVKHKEKVIEQDINLNSGSISLDVSNLKPGTYFWIISQEDKITEKHYFNLLP